MLLTMMIMMMIVMCCEYNDFIVGSNLKHLTDQLINFFF